jgi:hypothetical protein
MLFNPQITQPLVAAGVVSADETQRVMAVRPRFIVMRTGGRLPKEVDPLLVDYDPFLVRGEVTVLERR